MDKHTVVEKIKCVVESRVTLGWAHFVLWLYEAFFTLSMFGKIPGLETHFGGGLGDLFFALFMCAVLVVHPLVLLILYIANVIAPVYAVFFTMLVMPLVLFHAIALKGNFSGYETSRGARGLYYDRWNKPRRNYQPRLELAVNGQGSCRLVVGASPSAVYRVR